MSFRAAVETQALRGRRHAVRAEGDGRRRGAGLLPVARGAGSRDRGDAHARVPPRPGARRPLVTSGDHRLATRSWARLRFSALTTVREGRGLPNSASMLKRRAFLEKKR